MRLRLRGRLRALTLVPWYEGARDLTQLHARLSLEPRELRELIATEPGVGRSLRALLADLNPSLTGDGALADENLALRVHALIERGVIYVIAEPYTPMSSDPVELGLDEASIYASERSYHGSDHWIEVELLDEAGEPVVAQRCEITLPDDRVVSGPTDQAGLFRVAKTVAGTCTIRFPDLDAGAVEALTSVGRQGAQASAPGPSQAETHWVEVELLDESGGAVVGERCEITLPDGRIVRRRTDGAGRVRVARIAEAGDCEIRFPDLDAGAVEALSSVGREGVQAPRSTRTPSPSPSPRSHWIEVQLRGEDGRGVAGERCEITLPDGRVVRRKTDGEGLVRLASLAAAGDCEIRFPDLDARSWEAAS